MKRRKAAVRSWFDRRNHEAQARCVGNSSNLTARSADAVQACRGRSTVSDAKAAVWKTRRKGATPGGDRGPTRVCRDESPAAAFSRVVEPEIGTDTPLLLRKRRPEPALIEGQGDRGCRDLRRVGSV